LSAPVCGRLLDDERHLPDPVRREARIIAAGEAVVGTAPGTVRVVGGSARVTIRELTDGPAAVLLPKR
jgi:hypothetical protein